MLINGNSREFEIEKTIKVVSSPFTRKLRKLMYLAGLLTFPIINTFPSLSNRQWFFVYNTMSINDIGITATGIVFDFHEIPF